MHAVALAVCTVMLTGSTAKAASYSKAAQYLIAQEVSAGCPSGGRFRAAGAVERDLNGDGRKDLLLSHDQLICKGSNKISKRCGMQVCTVKVYLRQGPLLKQKMDFLGGGVTVGPTIEPVISGYAHGGDPWAIRWNGSEFR